MRVVLDTNTVVSGLLWDNQPRAIIEAAIEERIKLFTCIGLIEELKCAPSAQISYSTQSRLSLGVACAPA